MADDYKKLVIDTYAGGREEHRAENAGDFGMEFYYTKKYISKYINPDVSVAEIGCGTGYYAMEFYNKYKMYHGVDLSPKNIEIFREKIESENMSNVSASVGDATCLENLDDNSFDVVLALGPLYHLDHEDRLKCMQECRRICKEDGIIAFAYINMAGALAMYGASDGWQKIMDERMLDFVLDKGTDDARPGVYYYTMPEEILPDMEDTGLQILHNYGLDILLPSSVMNSISEDERRQWFRLADILSSSPSCTGLSNHALAICRNPRTGKGD